MYSVAQNIILMV